MSASWGVDQFQAKVVKVYANTYVVKLSKLPAEYVSGMQVRFKATQTNTGAVSVILQGLTVARLDAIPVLKPDGSALVAGDIQAGQVVHLIYDSATPSFQLQSFPKYTAPATSTSGLTALPGNDAIATIAHGLGVVPRTVSVTLVYVGAGFSGFAANDESPLWAFFDSGNGFPTFSASWDAVNVYVSQHSSTGTRINTLSRTAATGVTGNITQADWKLKVRASL